MRFVMFNVDIEEEGEGDFIPKDHFVIMKQTGRAVADGKVFEELENNKYFYGLNRFACFDQAMP